MRVTPSARAIAISSLLVVVDQITKLLALQWVPVVRNTGVSFGAWQHIDTSLVAATVILVAMITVVRPKASQVSELLIIAGGISNLIDRILRGAVIDWIPGILFHFNLADVMITMGVLWIFLSFSRTRTSSL